MGVMKKTTELLVMSIEFIAAGELGAVIQLIIITKLVMIKR